MKINEQILKLDKQMSAELKEVTHVLISVDRYNDYDEFEDELNELPIYHTINKHNDLIVYAILSINKGILTCGALWEDYGDIITIDVNMLEIGNKCYLYSLVL